MEVYVEEVFEDEEKQDEGDESDDSTALVTHDDFMSLMTENNILPLFFNPHKSSDAEQHKAFMDMTPAEREVLSLLGIELQCQKGDVLIQVSAENIGVRTSDAENRLTLTRVENTIGSAFLIALNCICFVVI